MLSRTADHVYWFGRYIERAENLARLLDVQYRLSLLPQPTQSVAAGWLDTLDELGALDEYTTRHGEVEANRAMQFLAFDRDSAISVYGCLRSARENARAVRGAITSEMWETMNSTWLEARTWQARSKNAAPLGDFIDWVKYRAQLLRGATQGTMLRDEAYAFMRMGSFLERADGTARILGARLATASGAPGASDYYQWSVVLRALSGFENYRKLFRDAVTPERVAELLVLRDDNPRSLRRAVEELYLNLRSVANSQSQETERRTGELHSQLHFARIETLVAGGLREFLDDFVKRLQDIDRRIGADFLAPNYAAAS